MLREAFTEALKQALKEKDGAAVSTLRLIIAALKDRDIAARGRGGPDATIGEDEIMQMLQTMVRQRHESIALYERGGRLELADHERREIGIIERFLPAPLDTGQVRAAVIETIARIGAAGLRDMGKVMAQLRADYAGRMDFAGASAIVKAKLAAR
ncbi:MAG: GatB/YqeY domain-containing protein [Alphaproteobacteria bacterium]|nr:GatB/YqeY domain-containing protein [Alphaproteobacteria bacterium]